MVQNFDCTIHRMAITTWWSQKYTHVNILHVFYSKIIYKTIDKVQTVYVIAIQSTMVLNFFGKISLVHLKPPRVFGRVASVHDSPYPTMAHHFLPRGKRSFKINEILRDKYSIYIFGVHVFVEI